MSSHSLDVGLAGFEQNVIEESRKRPVVVDFWAPWCGPCKSLKPILEKLAEEYGGKFLLAKVNSDENHELSTQFGVRGIPAVKAVVNGEIVDEFTGALPESAVREWLDRLIPSPAEELRVQAAAKVAAGDAAGALQILGEASKLDPQNEWVRLDAAEVLFELGQDAEAQRLLDSLKGEAAGHPRAAQLKAKLSLAAGAEAGVDESTLLARIAANGNDLDARLKLANFHAANGNYPQAFEQLLEIVQRDRAFEDDVGRKTMLNLFTLLGADPLVSEYRRKLAGALN
ncbi:MAG TPA: co-chaperone YbbN [Thiobacillaceae bacterium]|nr:co-chaperone YbbN [Thiobacillaceae bacterium]